MGVVLRQTWSESQCTVLMGYLILSQQMLDAIKHITDDTVFLSGRQRIGAHVL